MNSSTSSALADETYARLSTNASRTSNELLAFTGFSLLLSPDRHGSLQQLERVTPQGRPDAARGVQPGLRGLNGETPSCTGLCGDRTREKIQEAVIGPPSPFPSPSRGEGCVRNLQSLVDLFLTQTRDLHDFVAGTLASENFELRFGKIEKIRQERHAGGVGRPFYRRRRQPNVQGVSGPADDRVVGSPWLGAGRKGDVRPDNPLTGCG